MQKLLIALAPLLFRYRFSLKIALVITQKSMKRFSGWGSKAIQPYRSLHWFSVPEGKKLKFSGKNPSWLSRWGRPWLLDHKPYRKQLPTEDELKQWFTYPDTGIATMGGWNNTLWIDIDAKHFNCATYLRITPDLLLIHISRRFYGRNDLNGQCSYTQ